MRAPCRCKYRILPRMVTLSPPALPVGADRTVCRVSIGHRLSLAFDLGSASPCPVLPIGAETMPGTEDGPPAAFAWRGAGCRVTAGHHRPGGSGDGRLASAAAPGSVRTREGAASADQSRLDIGLTALGSGTPPSPCGSTPGYRQLRLPSVPGTASKFCSASTPSALTAATR